MGRPALKLMRIHVMLDPEVIEKIDALVGNKGRAKFVRQAVDRLLESADLIKKIETNKK